MTAPPQTDLANFLRERAGLVIWIALICAALMRMQGLGWDEWQAFHPDERNLVEAAARLSFADPVPDFYAYGGAALWLPRLLGWITDPACALASCLLLPARLISAVFAIVTVVLVIRLCQRFGGPITAVVAALLVAFSAPLIQWAHFGTTESALACLALALWLQAIRYLDGTDTALRAALVSSLLLGLGLGFKLSAASMSVIPLAGLAMNWPGWRRALGMIGVSVIICATMFVATNPALVVERERFLGILDFESRVVSGAEDVFWTWQFTGTTPGLYQVMQLGSMLGWCVALLSAIGIGWTIAKRKSWAMPALAFLIVYAAIVFPWHAKFVRYLAPVIPVLLIFAAVAIARLLAWSQSVSLRVALVAAATAPLASGIAMAVSFQGSDPRIVAAERLQARLSPGDTILTEPHEIGVFNFAGATTVVLSIDDISGRTPPTELAERLSGAAWMVLYSRRHWSVLPRLADRFPMSCRYYSALANGRLGFRVADKVSRPMPFGSLFSPSVDAEETRVVFDRPSVYLLQNLDRLPAEEIAKRLQAVPTPDRCTPDAIQTALEHAR
ncbi:MAG: glycosyltransferase family 39 protein [Pseudomonadota bacterium]